MWRRFRATGNERDLTGGRANTLRLALSRQLGPDAIAEEAVRDALDLCVSCKGCKRECPTGVDMARMKVEFTAHYKRRHGLTLRDRLIGHVPRYAKWIAVMHPLIGVATKLPGSGAILQAIRVDKRRALPQVLKSWTSRERRRVPRATGFPPVVLFAAT